MLPLSVSREALIVAVFAMNNRGTRKRSVLGLNLMMTSQGRNKLEI